MGLAFLLVAIAGLITPAYSLVVSEVRVQHGLDWKIPVYFKGQGFREVTIPISLVRRNAASDRTIRSESAGVIP